MCPSKIFSIQLDTTCNFKKKKKEGGNPARFKILKEKKKASILYLVNNALNLINDHSEVSSDFPHKCSIIKKEQKTIINPK